jgi:aspartate aminotransferase/aminotransferase
VLKHASYLDGIAEAMSVKFNNRVYEMKERGEDVVVLSLGEAFFDIPLFDFRDLPFPDIYHYSHSRGVTELRRKLAAYYRTQYRVPVDPETEIIVTAGSKMAIYMSLMAVIEPGDEVIIREPAWVSYAEQVRLCHGRPVLVPYHEPVEALGRYVSARTRALIVNNPHNPSGRVLSRVELAHLHELARSRGLFLIADEAYSDFLLEDDVFVSCGALDPGKAHTIVCNSMSKNYGMSGWRIGYAIANPEVAYQILKVNQHLVTCPATILELYLARHFDDVLAITKPQIRAVVERRRELAAYMDSLGLAYLPGSATFYFFVSIERSRLRSEEFCTSLLENSRVSVVPGIGYGRSCDGFVRVSIGTESMERTMQGIRSLAELIGKTAR